jgi:hypothetical protein
MAGRSLHPSARIDEVHELAEAVGRERCALLRGKQWTIVLRRAGQLLYVDRQFLTQPVAEINRTRVLALRPRRVQPRSRGDIFQR